MSQFLIVQYQIYIETTNQIQKQLIIKTYVINFYFIHDYNSNYQSKLIIINFHVSKKIQNQKKKNINSQHFHHQYKFDIVDKFVDK